MKSSTSWVIEPFSSSIHKRDSFTCGYESLDNYIRNLASQDVKRRVAQVFVACLPSESVVKGYYTLSAASFRKEELPADLAKKLPYYPVPAAILGRLAVDASCRGQGLGEYLLIDCFNRILQVNKDIAVNAVVVDAIDDKAKAFYQKYGFIPFASNPLKLFIPLAVIEKALP